MKNKFIKKIACFTAAVVFVNMLPVGNVTLAAAQIMSQNETAGDSRQNSQEESGTGNQDQVYGTGETDISAGTGQPTGTADTTQPDKSADTDQQGKAEGTDQPEKAEDTGRPDESADTDQPEKSEGTDQPENPDDPDKSDEPGQSGQPDEKDEQDQPKEPDKPKKPKLKKPVIKVSSKPDGSIKLKWNKVNGAAEYVIQRSTKEDSGFRSIYDTKKGVTSYKDSGRVLGKVYYYRLVAFSEGRASRADSKVMSGRALGQVTLTQISNVSGSRNLVVQWEPVTGADHYQIMRKNVSTGKYEAAGSVKANKVSFTDKNRIGGTIYTYSVCAADAAGGRGKYSDSMSQMAIDQNKKMIALTYDDGPSAYTPVVLDALAKNDGHATFFVVGNQVDRYADSVRRAVSMGCEIGNHTYDHSNLKNLSTVQVQSVLNRTNQAVKNQSGFDIRLVRPPYGSYNSAVSAAAGMPIIMWSIDTLDWKTRSTSATIQCVQQKAYDGAVVLMHDLHQPTALAADSIMRYLKSAGYQLVTVSELAAYRGGLKNGAAYSQFRK